MRFFHSEAKTISASEDKENSDYYFWGVPLCGRLLAIFYTFSQNLQTTLPDLLLFPCVVGQIGSQVNNLSEITELEHMRVYMFIYFRIWAWQRRN